MLLSQDSRGPEVVQLQKDLNQGGAGLQVDGAFGAKTKACVVQVQRALKQTVNGLYDTNWPLVLQPGLLTPADQYMTKLNVPYLTQRDNFHAPTGTCNITSTAMILAWKGSPIIINGQQLEDTLYDELRTPEATAYFKQAAPWAVSAGIPPQQVLVMLEWLLKRHGVSTAKFSTDRTKNDILTALDKSPVLLSGAFTKSGHIVLAIGKTKGNDLVVHDPWGDWSKGYGQAINGVSRLYINETIWKCMDKGGAKYWALTA